MFLGFAGQGYKEMRARPDEPGQQTTLGDYTVRMDDLRVTQDNQKQMMTGLLHRCSARRGDRQDVSGAMVL